MNTMFLAATDAPESSSTLPSDASSQYYAGLLYAYSAQLVDERDYIVGCSVQIDELDA